jgi:hypothetical protein
MAELPSSRTEKPLSGLLIHLLEKAPLNFVQRAEGLGIAFSKNPNKKAISVTTRGVRALAQVGLAN